MPEPAVTENRDPLSETEEKLLERAFQDFYKANQSSLQTFGGQAPLQSVRNEIVSQESNREVVLTSKALAFTSCNETVEESQPVISATLESRDTDKQPSVSDVNSSQDYLSFDEETEFNDQSEPLNTKIKRTTSQILRSIKKRRGTSGERVQGAKLEMLAESIIEQCRIAMESI